MKLLVEVNIFLKRIFLPPKPELCWETLASWEGCMVFWIFFLFVYFGFVLGFFVYFWWFGFVLFCFLTNPQWPLNLQAFQFLL